MFKKIIIYVFCAFFLLACGGKKQEVSKEEVAPSLVQSATSIQDIREIPQNLNYFLNQLGTKKSQPLASQASVKGMNERFMKLYYSAWSISKSSTKLKDIEYLFTRSNRGYAENLLPWTDKRWQNMQKNANLATFPNTKEKAIVLRATPLRELPTLSPRFINPNQAGQNYPFDLLQYATLPLGMPLFIAHTSADKAWYFIESSLLVGWVRAEDIATVDDDFIKEWKGHDLLAFTEDKVSLSSSNSFIAYANIGTLLPYSGSLVYVPVHAIPQKNARIVKVPYSRTSAKAFPLPFTAQNVALLGEKQLNDPYGWGGYLENRDCSAFLRDIFIPFGIWLPRNSKPQSQVGTVVNIENLSLQAKKAKIIKEAVPFASFIYLPGHIGLYIGEYKNEPVFLHNAWGLRTYDNDRLIIGRLAITSLEPAKEHPSVDSSNTLLKRITRFNIIGR